MFRDIMTHGNNTRLSFPSESNMSMSIHEDTGFCSGEDYMERELHSPTDTSEDSVEVKVSTISLGKKRKLRDDERARTFSGPLKKRVCQKIKAEADDAPRGTSRNAPFRPWSPPHGNGEIPRFAVPSPLVVKPAAAESRPFAYFRPPSPHHHQSEQPVSLVIKREKDDDDDDDASDVRVPRHPQIGRLSAAEAERMILKTGEQFPALDAAQTSKAEQKREQRNYKNMTRERRIEANARERTRVHTISAAFDTLRSAVPSYSNNQKLSKLSVLRIACSYIMTLSSLLQDDDGSEDGSGSSAAECVSMVSRTIQREGKLRKKKDDND